MKAKAGLSEIFGSLLVLLITLAIAIPLLLYFNSLRSSNTSAIGESYQKVDSALMTEFTVIRLGNTANETYLYNYGQIPIHITQVIINNQVYSIDFTLKPNQLVPLSSISAQIPSNLNGSTIIIEANGNYYTV